MIRESEAYQRWAHYYNYFIEKYSSDFTVLDYELLQIQSVIDWLSTCIDKEYSELYLSLIGNVSSYFEIRSLNNLLLKNVNACLNAAKSLDENPRWIFLFAYRANWALGRWDEAFNYINLALETITTNPDSREYASILQSLGSLELNRGNYIKALNIFSRAKEIYRNMGDKKGEIIINGEEAAYYLNKADYPLAFRLYSEIMDYELANNNQISDHTLLMMGVVSRRVRNYSKAIYYLDQLLQRAKIYQLRGTYATAAHHLAWTYFDQGQYQLVKEFGNRAYTIYKEVDDVRGMSDVDEQLGLVNVMLGEFNDAQFYLERCINIRKKLGNQQGYASSLRRMSSLRFSQGRLFAAIYYLITSFYLYYKIGMLSKRRILNFLGGIFNRRLVS